MAKSTSGIKMLKDGKVSIPLKNGVSRLIYEALLCRMIEEENEIIKTLLSEIRLKIQLTDSNRLKLMLSQFKAIIDQDTIRHLSPGEQIYLAASLNPGYTTMK